MRAEIENPAAAADAEQHARQDLRRLAGRAGRWAATAALPVAAAATVAWAIRRRSSS